MHPLNCCYSDYIVCSTSTNCWPKLAQGRWIFGTGYWDSEKSQLPNLQVKEAKFFVIEEVQSILPSLRLRSGQKRINFHNKPNNVHSLISRKIKSSIQPMIHKFHSCLHSELVSSRFRDAQDGDDGGEEGQSTRRLLRRGRPAHGLDWKLFIIWGHL